MNTVSGKSLSVELLTATILAALLLVPTASKAQTGNTATGTSALSNTTTGSYNTADGYFALFSNDTGINNVANGAYALYYNTTGMDNTANGYYALYSNIVGGANTANGYYALYSNNSGTNNTANGYYSLYSNTTGGWNTANGNGALYSNTTGNYNTANGVNALYSNTSSYSNTANGVNALYYNTGQYNTANGVGALYKNTTGNNSTADGYFALSNSTTGSSNIALGINAGVNITTGSNNIAIANPGLSADNGIIRIGATSTHKQTFIAGVSGVAASGGVAVYINANGQLGTLTSSARFKYDIQDMGAKSDKLMDLRPVTFRYKAAAEDGAHPVQYGLIAEEVAKVYPDLVQYDKQGKPFTVYYHLLTPMMLNELQKAHQQLSAQQTEINSLKAGLQNQNAALQNQLQSQSAALQGQSSEVASLRHTVQSLLMVVIAIGLAALIVIAYVQFARTRRSLSRRVPESLATYH